MSNKLIVFAVFSLFLLQSCGSVLESNITKLKKIDLEPLKLEPGYDLYSIRLDLIRETESANDFGPARGGFQGNNSQDVPYHRLGFHLGNNLFLDLNDNLSILVDKIYDIKDGENFEIVEKVSPQRRNRYTKKDDIYEERFGSLFSSRRVTQYSRDEEDGSLVIKESLLSKQRIYESEDELAIKYPLGKTAIRYDGKGYSVKQFLGRRNYVKIGKGISVDNKYFITQRNNRIEIFSNRSFSKKKRLLYTVIQGENEIIVYDRKNRGFIMLKDGDSIEYRRNRTPLVFYDREG